MHVFLFQLVLQLHLIDLTIGVFWGGIAGYKGGRIDEYMMRIADVLAGIPYLLLVILLMVVLGSKCGNDDS